MTTKAPFQLKLLYGGVDEQRAPLLSNDRSAISNEMLLTLEAYGISDARADQAVQELVGLPLAYLFDNRTEIATKILQRLGRLEPQKTKDGVAAVLYAIEEMIWRFELVHDQTHIAYLYGVRSGAYPQIDKRLRTLPVTDDDLAHCSVSEIKHKTVDFAVSEAGRRHVWVWRTDMPLLVHKLHAQMEARRKPWPHNLMAITSA